MPKRRTDFCRGSKYGHAWMHFEPVWQCIHCGETHDDIFFGPEDAAMTAEEKKP